MSRRNRQSRGVILLVVLGILALFALVGVVYVITSGQHNTAVRNEIKGEQVGDPPDTLLHHAVLEALVGSRNKISALQHHSLLEDLYGRDAFKGSVPSPLPTAGPGGAVQFDLTNGLDGIASPDDYNDYYTGCLFTITTGSQRGKSGLVVSYAQLGTSPPLVMRMRVMPFPGLSANQTIDFSQVTANDTVLVNGRPFNGTGFGLSNVSVNNLQPLDPNEPNLLSDALDPWSRQQLGAARAWPLALLPHPAFFRPGDPSNPLEAAYPLNYLDPAGPGGADEDYDAVDFQNWALAARMSTALGGAPRVLVAIPSFHRPELSQYWMERVVSDFSLTVPPNTPITWELLASLAASPSEQDAIRELARRSSLRPSSIDHFNDRGNTAGIAGVRDAEEPDFAGKFPVGSPLGPAYDPAWPIDRNGDGTPDGAGWDVDNDGDGTPDSIWVDLGFPVQRRPDGTLYKPLFAFLIEDLDGKLNLNAHGTLNHLADAAQQISSGATTLSGNVSTQVVGPLAGNAQTPAASRAISLPLGQGYGPAEANLHVLTDLPTGSPTGRPANPNNSGVPSVTGQGDLARLLTGVWDTSTNTLVPGRYGEAQLAAPLPSAFDIASSPPRPFVAQFQSGRDITMRQDMANPYFGALFQRTQWGSYALPPDLDGDGVIGLDLRGQPYFANSANWFGHGESNEKLNNPYDFDLSRLTAPVDAMVSGILEASDAPFTAAEFERMLRFSDIDSQSLPNRILALAPHIFQYDPLDAASTSPAYRRNLVTFASFDLPSPSVLPAVEMVWDDPTPTSTDKSVFDSTFINQPGATRLTDLVRARILEDNGSALPALVNASLPILLSPECRANRKFDVNRPFGDGRDNDRSQLGSWDSNGVVDEAEESYPPGGGTGQPIWPGTPQQAAFDANNDGEITFKDLTPGVRGEYARHLFVLTLLTSDKRFQAPVDLNNVSPAETVRRAAQWAVNVVDYRDRDVIMTPFEFDLEPFVDNAPNIPGTWDVDGVIGVNPLTGTSDDTQPWRGLVWGTERPETLITETLAIHDRRLEDTADENIADPATDPVGLTTTPPPDNDTTLDQARPPEGSLWIELYNPWRTISGDSSADQASWNQDLPAELYTNSAQAGPALELSRVSQETASTNPNAPGGPSPVWRLAIQVDSNGNGTGGFPDPDDDPDTANPLNNAKLTRFVYFRSSPTNHIMPPLAAGQRNYFVDGDPDLGPNPPVLLPPGRYMVCGPKGTPGYPTGRPTVPGGFSASIGYPVATIIGKHNSYNNSADASMQTQIMRDTRRIELVPPDNFLVNRPFPVQVFGILPTAATHLLRLEYPAMQEIDRPLAHVFVGYGTGERLNVSEPLGGHPRANTSQGGYSIVLDNALDVGPLFGPADSPDPNGIREGFFMVHVQRLANPLRVYDAQSNPYRTVDSMPIDVCVFNGEKAPSGRPETLDNFMLLSRQRGDSAPPVNNDSSIPKALAFWLQEPIERVGKSPYDPTNPLVGKSYTPATNDQHVFKWPLGHSLGYVNFDWSVNQDWNDVGISNPLDAENWIRPNSDGTVAYGPFTSANAPLVDYRGVRKDPTPWLAWPNRPFVSGHELMNVTATRSSRLMNPGSFKRSTQSPSSAAPFAHRAAAQPDDYAGDPWNHIKELETVAQSDDRLDISTWNKGPTFPHLLNFFQTKSDAGGNNDSSTGKAPQWHRVLDYVHVPSRFVGTETYLSPAAFGVGQTPAGSHDFYPPYNRLSNYREPGKINLNTIFDEGETWKAIVGYVGANEAPGMQTWNEVRRSRSGAANATVSDVLLPPADLPTRFGNPFRSAMGNNYVPVAALKNTFNRTRDPIDTTLLRANNAPDSYSGTPLKPLLAYDRSSAFDAVPNPTAPVDTNVNPNFRNLLLQKLGNLVTTRSNVYAAWVTVGYFEVERVSSNQQFDSNGHLRYPDGYRLKREVGVDNGQIERHRAFYLIDRTIPVAFERGETHNVENCILLRRFIE